MLLVGYTHFDKISANTLAVGGHGTEQDITATVAQINKIYSRFTVTALDGSEGQKACSTNGVSSIAGGTGIADMTLAAPSDGDVATIRIDAITSGTVVVTCAAGVTFDGTNNTATFDAADESLVLAYKSATEWQVVLNIGSVALSSV
jgi:hypothetical protein